MDTPPSYLRLLAAVKQACGITGQAAIAAWITGKGFDLSQQRLNNWMRRGVPDSACVHLGKILDCDPRWLYFDADFPAPSGVSEPATSYKVRHLPSEDDRLLDELHNTARLMSTTGKQRLIERASALLEQFPKASANHAQ